MTQRRLALLGAMILVLVLAHACSKAKPAKVLVPTTSLNQTQTAAPSSPGTPAAQSTAIAPTVAPTQTPMFYATPVPAPSQGLGPVPTSAAPGAQPQAQPTAQNGQTGAEGSMASYTVQAGDTLLALANRFGTTVEELARVNSMSSTDVLNVGLKLSIPASATNPPNVHIVQAGETLYRIAQKYGVDAQELVRLNNLADPNTLRVGQKLVLPTGSQAPEAAQPTAAGQARVHVVARGDTLYGIAARYGVTVQALAQANNLSVSGTIYVGQKLVIP